MNIDPKNQQTVASVIPAKSQANNTGAGGVDLKDFIGRVAVIVDIGAKTAGDADGAISVKVATSNDNNISNAVDYGTATVATNNATAKTGVISVDTRNALRYLFAIPTITGTNSPAYPLSVVAVGTKQTQP